LRGAVNENWLVCVDPPTIKEWKRRQENHAVTFFFVPSVIKDFDKLAKSKGSSRQAMLKFAISLGLQQIRTMTNYPDQLEKFKTAPYANKYD